MSWFRGVWSIVPTPLTLEEDVDEPALRRVIRYLIDGGVHGLWMLGSSGEQPLLSLEVQRKVLDIAAEEAKGHVPVVAGIGACGLRQAMVNLHMAEEAGVDGVQSVEPYYFAPRTNELLDYFLALADDAQVPMIFYHWPDRWPPGSTDPDMLKHTLGRLAEHPNIIGMKDEMRSLMYRTRIERALGDRFCVIGPGLRNFLPFFPHHAELDGFFGPRNALAFMALLERDSLGEIRESLATWLEAMLDRPEGVSGTALNQVCLHALGFGEGWQVRAPAEPATREQARDMMARMRKHPSVYELPPL